MALTALPPAPSRSDPAPTFITKADAFVAALPNLVDEINAALLAISAGSVADGGITTVKLANLAVTAAKIAALAVGTAQIADNAITTAKIADGQVSPNKLATNSVTTVKIADASVTAAKLAGGAAAANLGYTPFNVAGGTVTGATSFAAPISINSTSVFTSSMPIGPVGVPLGYAHLLPRYYSAPQWVDPTLCGGIMIAVSGCSSIVCTGPSNQVLPEGYCVAILNRTGGPVTIIQGTGVGLIWYNNSGTAVAGDRTLADLGTCTAVWAGNIWSVSGPGVF